MTCRVPEKSQKIQNMHNYAEICKICIFLKIPKNNFSGHILCFPENERITPILLWDGCYWFTEYGR